LSGIQTPGANGQIVPSRCISEIAGLLVLPVRIELTTSPFIALALSRPPRTAFVRRTIPSPWVFDIDL
jgi:hypothetical protein